MIIIFSLLASCLSNLYDPWQYNIYTIENTIQDSMAKIMSQLKPSINCKGIWKNPNFELHMKQNFEILLYIPI
jgi:hypothetical protein